MRINLNKQSWHFKLFKTFVSENPPKTLCPYFWISVCLIFLSPFLYGYKLINFLIKTVIEFFKKKPKPVKEMTMVEQEIEFNKSVEKSKLNFEKQIKREKIWDKIGSIISSIATYIFIPAIVLFALFCVGIVIYYGGFYKFIFSTIMMLVIIVSIIFSLILLSKVCELIFVKSKLLYGIKKLFHIIWEMIKAVYNKACPLIDWKTE